MKYIQKNENILFKNEQTYIPKNSRLPFPLEKDPKTGKVYLHLDETAHGTIGTGCNKTVFRSISVDKDPCVIARCEGKELSLQQKELEILMRVRDTRGLIHLIGYLPRPNNSYAFLLEYFNQGSLENLQKNPSFKPTEDQYLSIALDLLIGLSQLHALGIVHTDIHLGNILIHQTENQYKAAWNDFGVSCYKEPPQKALTVYSPFQPPEVLFQENTQRDLEKTETYAAGLCLFHLLQKRYPLWTAYMRDEHLSRYTPIEKEKVLNLMRESYEKTLRTISEYGKQKQLMVIILGLLHPDPEQRMTLKEAAHQVEVLSKS